MRRDGRLSSTLHALLHMAEHETPMTSEKLAECMQTNPAVVRRTMAGLREAGFVRSGKGHGGGWSIACDLRTVTLRDVYTALGEPVLLAVTNRSITRECLVEQAVNEALGDAYRDAEAMLLDRLGSVSLAKLSADFHRMMRLKRKQRKSPRAI
ncbi:MAG TPA: Rrf2 family transcriptional regulator [Bryobacteraceae bacterium]|nr:Rrf2 family transcriptional regulator [Bryobacteraceae bacterium]